MELSRARIEATAQVDLRSSHRPGVLIMPVGDIQYGIQDCSVRQLREHIQWGVDQGAYFLGMGDYIDYASPSNRQRLRGANTYDGTEEALDEIAKMKMQGLIREALEPSRGRWLGFLRGHHTWVDSRGVPTDMVLAEEMGAPYLGTCAMVGLVFPEGTVNIWCHHGAGYAQTYGGLLNRLERLTAAFDAHVYLIGHLHKLVAARPERIITNWQEGTLEHVSLTIACTGSFMQGYKAHRERGGIPEGSYVEQAMMLPAALGGILLHVAPRMREGLFIPDVSVSL